MTVVVVHFVGHFSAGDDQIFSVDDDYVVAGVDVVSEHWLFFASEQCGDLRCDTAERSFCGIDDVPLARDVSWFGAVSFHYLVSLSAFFGAAFLTAGVLLLAAAAAGFAAFLATATGASLRSSTKLTFASCAWSPRRVRVCTMRRWPLVRPCILGASWSTSLCALSRVCNLLMTCRRLCRSPFFALVISFSTYGTTSLAFGSVVSIDSYLMRESAKPFTSAMRWSRSRCSFRP